ncbi:MAG: IS200/IS605 family transposase [Pirellulaceae bacterium]
MPQSLAKILVHVVFSTKHRTPWLKDSAVRHELHAYLTKTLQTLECPPSACDGVADHIHFLCQLSRKIRVMDLIEKVKTASSKWIKTKGPAYGNFYWQGGYGAFSVSESSRRAVIEYIRRQEEHHRQMTFQDEFRTLCRKHGIEIDERYVWD